MADLDDFADDFYYSGIDPDEVNVHDFLAARDLVPSDEDIDTILGLCQQWREEDRDPTN